MLLSNHPDEQVIASLLIILRVANKSALTSDTIAPGSISSIHFTGRGRPTGGNGTVSDGHPTNSTGTNEGAPGELGARDETAVKEDLLGIGCSHRLSH